MLTDDTLRRRRFRWRCCRHAVADASDTPCRFKIDAAARVAARMPPWRLSPPPVVRLRQRAIIAFRAENEFFSLLFDVIFFFFCYRHQHERHEPLRCRAARFAITFLISDAE